MRHEHGVLRVRRLPDPHPSGLHPAAVDDGLGYRRRHPQPSNYQTDWSYRADPRLLPPGDPCVPTLPNPRTLRAKDRIVVKYRPSTRNTQWSETVRTAKPRVSNSPRR